MRFRLDTRRFGFLNSRQGSRGTEMAGTVRGRIVLLRLAVRLLAVPFIAAVLAAPSAWAQIGSVRYSSIVVDAATGEVLEAANPDAPRHPASLAKMMTLYMTFEAL